MSPDSLEIGLNSFGDVPTDERTLHPVMRPGGIPTWIGVGGSPNSVVRAARCGLPLILAVIGGQADRVAGHVDLSFRALGTEVAPRTREILSEERVDA